MRYTKKVSMWPVGLVTKLGLSSPIVKNGKFDGFYDGWIAGRKFPVDMAEFAVNVKFLLQVSARFMCTGYVFNSMICQRPKATMPYKPGFEEEGFLKSLAPFDVKEIELLANECTEVKK